MMRITCLLMAVIASLLTGCDRPVDSADIGKVRGEASYRERIAVPSGTRLEVTLRNESAMDPRTRLVTRIVVAKAGQPPYRFEVPYRRADIVEGHRYVVTARLLDRENVLFESAEPVPVITRGHPSEVEILLVRPGVAGRNRAGGGNDSV